MNLSQEELEFGYWPARNLRGLFPSAIRRPEEFTESNTLNLACTQTGLSASRQKALVREWCSLLPQLKLKTLVFSSKVSQELFDAACQIPGLEALSVKWSSVRSLDALSNAGDIRALFLGGTPAAESLVPLSSLTALEHLFVEGVPDPVDLSIVESLQFLREFGLSAVRGRKIKVRTLGPLATLELLEVLWLVDVKVLDGGLLPLYSLNRLCSFRTTISQDSKDFQALLSAVPSIKYLRRVG